MCIYIKSSVLFLSHLYRAIFRCSVLGSPLCTDSFTGAHKMIRSLLFLCLTISLACGSPVLSEEAVCDLCLDVVKDAGAATSDQRVFAQLVAGMERVCEAVGPEVREECGTVLNGLSQEVLYQLLQDMEPRELCVAMTACPVQSPDWARYVVPRNAQPLSVVNEGASDACELCQLLVSTIDTLLKNRTSPQFANATAYRFCDALPPNLHDTCITFVPLIVDMLTQGVDPAGACTNIGICMTETKPPVQPKPAAINKPVQQFSKLPSAGPYCQVCELLVQTVDQYLQENKTEAAINATVYKLCNDLPASIKSTCLSVAPLVVSTLSKGVDPKTACTFLKLCDSTGVRKSFFTTEMEAQLPSDKPYCAICELLVKTVDSFLAENRTEAAINNTVYELCNALPDGIKDQCLSVAPKVVSTLHAGVDPETACEFLQLCDPTALVDVPLPKTEPVGDGPYCQVCELLVQTVDQYLQENKTEAAINATVYKLCNDLPASIKSTCLSVAPLVVSTLSKGVDPKTACTFLKLCDTTGIEIMPPKAMPLQDDGPVCEVCEMIVDAMDQYLKENSTFEAINSTVYKLCNDLPDTIKATCMSLAPLVVTTLSNGVDPKTACTFAKMCDATGMNHSQRKVAEKVLKQVTAGPYCEVCELVIEAIDDYLKENSTEAFINSTVYQLCNALPGSLKDTCLSFAPQLVTTLANGVDPKQACTTLKLCDSTNANPSQKKAVGKVLVQVTAGPYCEVCELVIEAIDDYLKENSTEAFINSTVYQLCNALPGSLKDTCLSFAPQLVTTLESGVDPKQACTTLKLCDSTNANPSQKKAVGEVLKHVSDGPYCEVCELVIEAIDDYLKENSTEAFINSTVYQLCNALPGSLKDTCLSFAPDLVTALSNGVDPKQACTTLKLCDSTRTAQTLLKVRDAGMGKIHINWCTVCKDHVGILDQDLYRDEPTIQSFLDGICHRLPSPTDQGCLKAADTNFPRIWESFLNGTGSAENICKLLKACSN